MNMMDDSRAVLSEYFATRVLGEYLNLASTQVLAKSIRFQRNNSRPLRYAAFFYWCLTLLLV